MSKSLLPVVAWGMGGETSGYIFQQLSISSLIGLRHSPLYHRLLIQAHKSVISILLVIFLMRKYRHFDGYTISSNEKLSYHVKLNIF